MSGQDGLVTTEGVDEGSAASTAESSQGHAEAHPGAAQEEGLLGEPPRGAPVDEAQAAGPVDMESEQSRAARDAAAPGQQLQEGEG